MLCLTKRHVRRIQSSDDGGGSASRRRLIAMTSSVATAAAQHRIVVDRIDDLTFTPPLPEN